MFSKDHINAMSSVLSEDTTKKETLIFEKNSCLNTLSRFTRNEDKARFFTKDKNSNFLKNDEKQLNFETPSIGASIATGFEDPFSLVLPHENNNDIKTLKQSGIKH